MMLPLLLSILNTQAQAATGILKSLDYTQTLPGCERRYELTLDQSEKKEFISLNGLVIIKPSHQIYNLTESQVGKSKELQGKKVLIEVNYNQNIISLCSQVNRPASIKEYD